MQKDVLHDLPSALHQLSALAALAVVCRDVFARNASDTARLAHCHRLIYIARKSVAVNHRGLIGLCQIHIYIYTHIHASVCTTGMQTDICMYVCISSIDISITTYTASSCYHVIPAQRLELAVKTCPCGM